MRAVGIICEYNPFHTGHMHQICEAKKLSGADAVVCVMSGAFVQRGQVALFDKWERARQALLNGADLVIELPAYYVLQSAKEFAFGGVSILEKSHLTDCISFGSECGDGDILKKCAEVIHNESDNFKKTIEKLMGEGQSYPSAVKSSIDILYPHLSEYFENPNDMLGITYISAIKSLGSGMDIFPVKRLGEDHKSQSKDGITASSTAIRNAIENGENPEKFMPYDICGDTYSMKNIESLILGHYRLSDEEKLKNIPGIEIGFEKRLISSAKKADSIDEFFSMLTSKRYTLSRAKRIVLAGLIGMEKGKECDYVRILGMTDRGAELLKQTKEKTELPFVVKTADFSPSENSTFKYDIASCDIASLCCDNPEKRKSGNDFFTSPVKV